MSLPRVAVLDDYQQVALSSADWSAVTGRADITVFTDHVADSGDLAGRLAPYDVIVAMRERTPFPAALLTSCLPSSSSSPPACAMHPSTSRRPSGAA